MNLEQCLQLQHHRAGFDQDMESIVVGAVHLDRVELQHHKLLAQNLHQLLQLLHTNASLYSPQDLLHRDM